MYTAYQLRISWYDVSVRNPLIELTVALIILILMKKIFEDVQTQATLTKMPPIMSLLPHKRIKKKQTRYTQIFFGNKAYEQFRRMRDVGERLMVWW